MRLYVCVRGMCAYVGRGVKLCVCVFVDLRASAPHADPLARSHGCNRIHARATGRAYAYARVFQDGRDRPRAHIGRQALPPTRPV